MGEERHRVARERQPAGDGEIEDAAERVEVGSAVERPVMEDELGREERRRPGDLTVAGQLRAVARVAGHALDDAEIEDLEEVAVRAELAHVEVGRLDVAVDEPGAVRLLERAARLADEVDRTLGQERTEAADQLVEIEPLEHLHDVVERSVLADPEIVEPDRVRREQARGRPGLALEALAHRLAVGHRQEVGAHQLDRRRPGEELVASAPHLAHPARPELLDQPIRADLHPALEQRRVNVDQRPARRDHHPLDEPLQLAQVPWPGVSAKALERLGRNPFDDCPEAAGVGEGEVVGECRDVALALAQRRHPQLAAGNPREQRAVEGAAIGLAGEIEPGVGDDPDVRSGARRPRQELAQMLLERPRHPIDAVEEERAAGGEVELARGRRGSRRGTSRRRGSRGSAPAADRSPRE